MEYKSHLTLKVLIAPRASRSRIMGIQAGRLKIAVTAAPVDGAANEALLKFLAKLFDHPKRAFGIERGQTSREKDLSISGLSAKLVTERLKSALGDKLS
ncbi:MAG: YggU family protein [Proteobacteria bacterium]|nr:MAG: YggU family protein [Pseudomonadota bacterium]